MYSSVIYTELSEHSEKKKCCCFPFKTTITIDWNENYQTIQGFGTFAGRSLPFYKDPKRDKILDFLFGEKGLQLTVLRSTIFPDFDFGLSSEEELTDEQIAEFWILKTAKKRYNIDKIIASAWSPPYVWKTRPGENTGKNLNSLAEEHYANFANYIVNFVKWYKIRGIDFYAISPQNEPEFPTRNWDGCVWFPDETAKFIKEYLRPLMIKSGLNTKLIIGETGNWNVADVYLYLTSRHLNREDFDIYASHGYSLPKFPKFSVVTYNTNVNDWYFNRKFQEKERWITEISSTDSFNPSMSKAIKFAISLQQFLTNGNVNGFIFWLGMLNDLSNEAIVASKNESIYFPKIYDVYGQFSRYIKPGWTRIKTSKSLFSFNSNIHVCAFKQHLTRQFSVILINSDEDQANDVNINFQHFSLNGESIEIFLTDENNTWTPVNFQFISSVHNDLNSFHLTMPKLSVMTLTAHAIT